MRYRAYRFLGSSVFTLMMILCIVVCASSNSVISEEAKQATHKQAYTIKPEVRGREISLQTFCVGPRGNLWMACRSTLKDGTDERGLIMVYDPNGLLFESFPLSFVPQAINFSPKDRLYVAGSGKVARVALSGVIEAEVDAPNIGRREVPVLKHLLNATGIAATDNEVYVACPVTAGYGVWRLSPDLTVEAQVIGVATGCCGHFDIQTDGKNLIIAENMQFEIGIYDRNGKRLSGFGKRASDTQDGFGSSCNPMNVCCQKEGEILTAESGLGHIKRFDKNGKLLSFVGTANVSGECKRVPIGFDPARNTYYMMHEDLSHVAVLVLKEEAPE